jgi:hypothetical protein
MSEELIVIYDANGKLIPVYMWELIRQLKKRGFKVIEKPEKGEKK